VAQATPRKIKAGEIELAIAEAGTGGRPLLLLHGFTGAKEDFTEWLEPLAGCGWHVVAPDLRGHGESSKPASEDAYSLAIMAGDAFALADALSWSRFVLLGHSMGGMVAQVMALSSPERLDGLVLMDTAPGPLEGVDTSEAEAVIAIARERGIDALADILAKRDSPLDSEAHKRLLAQRPGYAEFGERKLRASSPYLYASMVPQMVRHQTNRLAALATLDASLPVLVIVGEQDTPFQAPSERMARAIPGARLSVIGDAGHSPQFENPEGWWDALSKFLELVRAAMHG